MPSRSPTVRVSGACRASLRHNTGERQSPKYNGYNSDTGNLIGMETYNKIQGYLHKINKFYSENRQVQTIDASLASLKKDIFTASLMGQPLHPLPSFDD